MTNQVEAQSGILAALAAAKQNEEKQQAKQSKHEFTKLPAGTYEVKLTRSDAFASNPNVPGSKPSLLIQVEVISGSHKGEKESVFPTLETTTRNGSPMPQYVLVKNIELLRSLVAGMGSVLADDAFTVDPYECYKNIASLLKEINKDQHFGMTIKVTPNHKNPQYPYRDYRFGKAPEAPAQMQVTPPARDLSAPSIGAGATVQQTQATEPVMPKPISPDAGATKSNDVKGFFDLPGDTSVSDNQDDTASLPF